MLTTLKNQWLSISVSSQGAEITSIRSNAGNEYLWQGDPAVWNGQSPNLFPFIGKINHSRYRLAGKEYSMTKHGFARTSEFKLINQTQSSATYRLSNSDETIKNYPFQFDLDISFILDEKVVRVLYKVINKSKTKMPFSLGAHPAFAMNWTEGDSITDYYIEFDQTETCAYQQFNGTALGRNEHSSLINTSILNINKSMFNIDATIYHGLKSEAVTLRSKQSDRSVRVEFPSFSYLGFWSKPAAPYICIEPWFGVDDYEDFNGDIMEKDGIEIIAAGDSFNCEYRIIID